MQRVGQSTVKTASAHFLQADRRPAALLLGPPRVRLIAATRLARRRYLARGGHANYNATMQTATNQLNGS